jgi:hypothetical protein
MSDSSSGGKTPIVVAVVGAVGILGAAIIANWDKLSRSNQPPPNDGSRIAAPAGTASPTPTVALDVSTVADAERLTARYVEAVKRQNVDSIVEMSSVPFFFDEKVLLSKAEIRSAFEKWFHDEADKFKPENIPAIDSLKGQTVGEFRQSAENVGLNPNRDRVLNNVRIESRDFVVTIRVKNELTRYFVRHEGPSLSMAGFWG